MTDPPPLQSCKLEETQQATTTTDVNGRTQPKTSAACGCFDKKPSEAVVEMTGVTTATAMKGSRPRQRKTAVYKRFWNEDAPEDDDVGEDAAGQRIPGRSGSGSFSSGVESDDEMIRFPCVERLIELYANIIKQKEAETARFASRVVAGRPPLGGDGGDKGRLDKTDGTGGDKTATANVPAELQSNAVSSTSVDASSSGGSVRNHENTSPASEEDGWSATRQSPYCSSDEEDELAKMKPRDKVTRSSSSDSALGLDEDLSQQEQQQIISSVGKARRMTLGVSDIPLRSALLPVPEPALLPTADCQILTSDHHQCPAVVRSKMILEAQLIELPSPPIDGSTEALGCLSNSISRRESAQSYVSDSGMDGVRYVRTPSVVVSDYSDDTMCGITLEEIEYLRRHRLRRASTDCESDVSAASSCSNLNYCGSSISALEGCDYQCGLRTPERKVSDCSTCSTLSCEDADADTGALRNQLQDLGLRSEEQDGRRRTKKKVCEDVS